MLNKLSSLDKENLLGGVDNKSIYVYTDPEKYGENDEAGVLAIRGFYEAKSGSYFKVAINEQTKQPEIVWDSIPSDINGRMIQLAQLLDIRNNEGQEVVDKDAQDWIENASFDASQIVDNLKDDIQNTKGDVTYAHERIDALFDIIPEYDDSSIDKNNFDKWQLKGFDVLDKNAYPRATVGQTGERSLEWVSQLIKIEIQVEGGDAIEITDPHNPDSPAVIVFSADNFSDIDVNNKTIKLSWAKWE